MVRNTNPHGGSIGEVMLQDEKLRDVLMRDGEFKSATQEHKHLLNIYSQGAPPIPANSIISTSSCLLGMSGMGKTNALACMLEELAIVRISGSVIDNEGDIYTISETHPNIEVIMVKKEWSREQIFELADTVIKRRKITIINFSPTLRLELRRAWVFLYISKLSEAAEERFRTIGGVPHLLVVDEAHLFMPQRYSTTDRYITDLNSQFATIAQMGRKRGLGLLIATTRIARLNKDVLSQMRVRWFLRATMDADIDSYKTALIPLEEVGQRIGSKVKTIVSKLDIGSAFYIPDAAPLRIVHFRVRNSRHLSKTPTIEDYDKANMT